MHVLGPEGAIVMGTPGDGTYALEELQRIFMFSRSETIYAGSSEIQRNIIGERVLGSCVNPVRDECHELVPGRAGSAARRRRQFMESKSPSRRCAG
jgi:hypothetical protein